MKVCSCSAEQIEGEDTTSHPPAFENDVGDRGITRSTPKTSGAKLFPARVGAFASRRLPEGFRAAVRRRADANHSHRVRTALGYGRYHQMR